jgi:hypothetical protein
MPPALLREGGYTLKWRPRTDGSPGAVWCLFGSRSRSRAKASASLSCSIHRRASLQREALPRKINDQKSRLHNSQIQTACGKQRGGRGPHIAGTEREDRTVGRR